MADINKVWLSGIVVSQPILTRLGSKTPFTSFSIQVNERFLDRNGLQQSKANLIRVESLGKAAEKTAQIVKQGARFSVDGYLRQDNIEGEEQVRVRSFAVYADDSNESTSHKEGIRQAIEVLKRSRDLPSALRQLEELADF